MKEVTIVIAGKAKQGKSTVAAIVSEALKAHGISVRMFDHIDDITPVQEVDQTNVIIKTVTTTRSLELV